ncbi:hypothetical protein CsatA_020837 [Cannabis sativa]
MADPALDSETPSLHQTQPLKEIAIDYNPEACAHCADSNSITHLRSAPRISVAHHHSPTFTTPAPVTEKRSTIWVSIARIKFHLYVINWGPDSIEWLIDGKIIRTEERKEGLGFPHRPMFLYASIWDASYIAKGSWTGTYVGCDAPYHCLYKEIHVPAGTVVVEDI